MTQQSRSVATMRSAAFSLSLGLGMVLLSALASTGHVVAEGTTRGSRPSPVFVEAESGDAPGLPASLADLARATRVSVVTLESYDPESGGEPSHGTGFVISERGLIVTSTDLTQGRRQVRGRFSDGSDLPLVPVGQDPESQLALFEIPGDGPRPPLKPIAIGDSAGIRSGQWIMTFGKSDGAVPSVTKGILAGFEGDPTQPTNRYLRLDLPIVWSYAGGPVVDMKGRLVGMIASSRRQPGFPTRLGSSVRINGFSFAPGPITLALPSQRIRQSIERLLARRTPPRAVLGVRVKRSGGQARSDDEGARVASVIPYSSAAAAEVAAGDVIVEFNRSRIGSDSDLTQAVSETRPGQKVTLVVVRDGKRRTLKTQMTSDQAWFAKESDWGFEYAPLDPDLRMRLSLSEQASGVVVTEVARTGPAARAGLQLGDRILSVNRRRVDDVASLRAALRQREPVLLIQRDNATRFVVLIR